MKLISAFMSLSVMLCVSTAFGTILVDYGDADSSSTLGGVWNTVDSALSGTVLLDTTGASSGVTITFGGDGWLDTSVNQGPWPAGDKDWVDADATVDYTFNTGGQNSSVTFSGLTPGGLYHFEHVAARSLGDRIADYKVNGLFADSTPNGDNFNARVDGFEGGNILVWDAVSAGSSGQVVLTVSEVIDFGYLSASLIEQVPEPSTHVMLGMLGVMALAIRRRR